MSLLSVAAAVIFMFVFIPVMTNANRQSARAAIEDTFWELEGSGASFTEEAWTMRLVSFSASVANYGRAYPKDTVYNDRHHRYEKILNGFDPDTIDPDTGESVFVGDTNQDRHNLDLIENTRDNIIDLTGLSLSPPDSGGNALLTVLLENRSDLIISEVRMAFEAFDASGNPSNGSTRGDNQWFVRASTPLLRPNMEESYIFQVPWTDRGMSDAKILWMEIEYGPNRSIYLPPAVCKALWRE
jgi:hypothetical protein